METDKFESSMGNIRTKIRTYRKQGKNVLYSAIFITGKEKVKLVDRAPVAQLSLVTKNLQCETPDKVRIELYDGKETPNPLWIKELLIKQEIEIEPQQGFKGLGEAEINEIVDQRFKERQRAVEYEQLKEQVIELTNENEELQDSIEELEDENTRLEQELEAKKQARYYAGMLGDIFESFGIDKGRIKKPIAELMGINDTDEKPKQVSSVTADSSGIVEEPASQQTKSAEEQKRTEIISLIADYLKSTSNQTLANVFSIFSEIEADNGMADKIIQHINTLKTEEHAKV
ncbi:MAG: hypothetical protein HXX16_03760 [Bacteroidales bacterium]|nr:hypothetical protein [Bacteroidales bacterium]